MFVAFIMGLPCLTQLAPQDRLVSMLREGQGIIYKGAVTVNVNIESLESTPCPGLLAIARFGVTAAGREAGIAKH